MAEKQYKLGRRKGFTVVYRSVAQDSRLSLKARGLFLLMQSLPDDWKFTIAGLATKSGAGVKQIRNALEELETVGYLIREQTHSDNGTFAGNTWILQEEAPAPLCQNGTTVDPENTPLCQKASAEKALTENGTLQNTILTNTPLTPQGGVACADKNSGERRAATSPGRNAPKWKPERFERFWAFYRENAQGKHGHRAAAVKAWDKLRADDDTINKMGLCLLNQSQSDMWRRGVGIPYASSWLNRRDWEDEAEPMPDVSPMEVTGWTD